MKFTVELVDFWLEEEELAATLKSEIKRDVIAKIQASIRDQVEKQITAKIEEVMKSKMAAVIDEAVTDFIAIGSIKIQNKEVPIKQHLQNIFEGHTGWTSPADKMIVLAKKFGEDLKVQYNNIFAGKIVVEMQKQGFLKDDMAKILLGETPK